MRARRKGKKLGVRSGHRLSLLSNLACNLLRYESITTTVDRAKEASRLVDRLITRAKKGTLHDRRIVAKSIGQKDILKKLFDDVAKRNADRLSGHTRLLRLPPRKGDRAQMVIWQLVDNFSNKEDEKTTESPLVEDHSTAS